MTIFAAQTCGNGKATTSFHFIVQPSPLGTSPTSRQRSSRKYRSHKKSAWAAVLLVCQVAEHSLPHSSSRFGHLNSQTRAQGDLITLSQSDKWLRQAKVIDGWNVTTTDTAIAFRKISRGSTRLSYPGWLVFLRELAETKKLPLPQVWARLEQVFLQFILGVFGWKRWFYNCLSVLLFFALQILSHTHDLSSISYMYICIVLFTLTRVGDQPWTAGCSTLLKIEATPVGAAGVSVPVMIWKKMFFIMIKSHQMVHMSINISNRNAVQCHSLTFCDICHVEYAQNHKHPGAFPLIL